MGAGLRNDLEPCLNVIQALVIVAVARRLWKLLSWEEQFDTPLTTCTNATLLIDLIQTERGRPERKLFMRINHFLYASFVALILSYTPLLYAQGSAFVYQGLLTDSGGSGNGGYDLRFTLYDTNMDGSPLGIPVEFAGLNVTNGLFTVSLDFGAGAFTGAARWLEIGVRAGGSATNYATLSPRQLLTPTPYAVAAETVTGIVPGAGLAGNYPASITFSNALNSFSGSFAGNGSLLSNVDATTLGGLSSTSFAQLAVPNIFTSGETFVGPVVFEGQVSFLTNVQGELEADSISAGSFSGNALALTNFAASNLIGVLANAQLAGDYTNLVTFTNPGDQFIGSFAGNGAGLTSLKAGNISLGVVSVVNGGTGAGTAAGARVNLGAAAIGTNGDITALSGLTTQITVEQGGTGANTASNALVNLGGASLTASNFFCGANAFAASANQFTGSFAGNGGALSNVNTATLTGLLPGNLLGGTYGNMLILNNPSNSFGGTFWGDGAGMSNLNATALSSGTVSDGRLSANVALLTSSPAFSGSVTAGADLLASRLSVGSNHVLTGTFATIAGGESNINQGPWGSIGGGHLNLAAGTNATVAGGAGNQASGQGATVMGGENNLASGQYSLAAGRRAKANHDGALVWADASDADFGSTANNQFLVRAGGGCGINTNNPGGKTLSVNGTVGITATNTLEFGADVSGKQPNAGKIGYQSFTPGALDIVGAGTNATSRRIKFWAESGATFNGTGTNPLVVLNNTVDDPTSLSLAAPFSTWRVGQNKPPDAPGAFDSFFIYQENAGATRLLITADGRVGLGTNSPGYPLHLASGAFCTAGGVWTSVSDRAAKQGFRPIQPKQILAKVASLPITKWSYKAEGQGVQHLGPMAQDFHAAFGLGDSEKTIGSVDADGVALAAIQGLNQIVKENEAEIRALRTKNQDLELRLKNLERLLGPESARAKP
jgi:hypothetical protein